MQQAKSISRHPGQRAPVFQCRIQQPECTDNIRHNERLRPQNRPVDVALRREMHDRVRLIFGQQPTGQLAIANISAHKGVARS
jgi:hypothetical protein